MTNTERILANNADLQECIELAESLPDAGGGSAPAEPLLQEKTVTPTKSAQTIEPDAGYDGLSKVNMGAIPEEYIIPSGTKSITANGTHDVKASASVSVNVPVPGGYIKPSGAKTITENGTHDVTSYASAEVNVPIPDGYIKPAGTKEITENGTHDVTGYASAEVDVPAPEPVIRPLTVTENGTYTVPDGVDGYSPVVVEVAGSSEPDPRELYQRVEYIKSDGTAYIVTDICADNSCGMEMTASFPSVKDVACMGSRQDSGNTRFFAPYPLSSSSTYFGFNAATKISASISVNTIYRWQTNFLNSRLAIVTNMNGVNIGSTAISATLTQHTAPIHIFNFVRCDIGTISAPRDLSLYGARISEGNEVVREYIPCRRKSDGVVGLLEKFTGAFLTAEAGGVFAAGSEIDW